MSKQTKPSIVFVHGLWADGSCFGKLIPTLQAEGHGVIAAQFGLDALASDVAAVKGALVEVAELRLGNGLGGRGLAILGGTRTDVEAAAEIAGRALAGRSGTLCHSIISNVHEQFAERLEESSRFFKHK